MTGIEPAQSAWKAETLPLSYIRTRGSGEPCVRLSWHTPWVVLTPVEGGVGAGGVVGALCAPDDYQGSVVFDVRGYFVDEAVGSAGEAGGEAGFGCAEEAV